MQQSERRIHQLKVTGKEQDAIGRHVTLLEDAFNTASLPGLPPNGLLLIRHLDIGSIVTNASPMAISQLIDKKIWTIAKSAVCVDHEEKPDAAMVWFSDTVQPVITLVDCLARHKQPTAWYWRAALPLWRPGMNLQQTLTIVLNDYIHRPAKAVISARIIRQLLMRRAVSELLQSFTPQLATQLLHEANIFPVGAGAANTMNSPIVQHPVSSSWQSLIMESGRRWGRQDPRTLWFAYSALVVVNPAIVESQPGLSVVSSFIQQLQSKYSRIRHQDPSHDGAIADNDAIRPHKPTYSIHDQQPNLSNNKQPVVFSETQTLDGYSHDPAEPALREFSNLIGTIPDTSRAPDHQVNDDNKQVMEADSGSSTEGHDEAQANAGFQAHEHQFLISDFAGMGFVIPLLELIGMRELLKYNAWLAEINLPARVLFSIAKRFHIPDTDPVTKFLPELPHLRDFTLQNFVAPHAWKNLINTSCTKQTVLLRWKIKGKRESCYLTDPSGKRLLYVQANATDTALPEWMANITIVDQKVEHLAPCLADIENTIQLLCGGYVRRYAGISLRRLLRREGYVALTTTHLDILLDPKSADIRIRKAGLDLDPGWVTWLGKVVQFHYDHEGYVYV